MAQVLYAPNWTVLVVALLAPSFCLALMVISARKLFGKQREPRGPIVPKEQESDTESNQDTTHEPPYAGGFFMGRW